MRNGESDRGKEQAQVRAELRRRREPVAGPPDPSLPVGTDTLPAIKHIVVLMMENHSYDSYLGILARGDGYALGEDGKPSGSNAGTDGIAVSLHPRGNTSQERGLPSQSWHASHVQRNAGANDGFVRGSEPLLGELPAPLPDPAVAMAYWGAQDLPFYHSLASTFPLMDRWFASCMGPTFPNRRFLISGTAHGLIDNVPTGLFDYPEAGTIFDLLTAHGIDWVNYHHLAPVRSRSLKALGAPGLKTVRALGLLAAQVPGGKHLFGLAGIREYLMSKLQFTANLYPLRRLSLSKHLRHLRSLDDFFCS